MIRTVGLGKKYGDFWAVRDLNLNIRKGEIYGFLGPNGAGKSTTILMILAVLRPTAGQFYLFGNQISGSMIESRRKIGAVSENQHLYLEMTMREYLNFFGELYRVRNRMGKIEELAERVELADVLDKRLRAFSRGMQQKVGIIRALLNDPELLILDEPISGLDPMGIHQVRSLIEEENKKGKTVIISSHMLSEVEKLCDRVGIINNGKLLAEERMANLAQRLAGWIELDVELPEERHQAADLLKGLDFVIGISGEGRFIKIRVKTDRDYRHDVVRSLISQGLVPVGIQAKPMSLEEVFVAITKDNISLLTKTDA